MLAHGSHPLQHQRNLCIESLVLLCTCHVVCLGIVDFGLGLIERALHAEADAPVLVEVVGPVEAYATAEAQLMVYFVVAVVIVYFVLQARQSAEAADRKFVLGNVVVLCHCGHRGNHCHGEHCCATSYILDMFHCCCLF